MVSMHLAMGMSVTRSSLDDSGSGITCSLRREPCAAAAQARRVCAPASEHLEGHSGWQQLHMKRAHWQPATGTEWAPGGFEGGAIMMPGARKPTAAHWQRFHHDAHGRVTGLASAGASD